MNKSITMSIDVTEFAGLGETLSTAATVTYPAELTPDARTVVCFGFPGGGYNRKYFTFDMPGSETGGEAGWHAEHGWVFVSCDHLGIGDSDAPAAGANSATLDTLVSVNAATADEVWSRLRMGTVAPDLPPLTHAIRIGIGQSMAGSLLIMQQGQHRTFDAVGILGTSAIEVLPALEPGTPQLRQPYLPRGASTMVTPAGFKGELVNFRDRDDGLPLTTWGFHCDDVPADIIDRDMRDWPLRSDPMPEWACQTVPAAALAFLTPGVILLEASVIDVPVFLGYGERDMSPNPRLEPFYFRNSNDVTVCVYSRMAHMHNFASSRVELWSRLHSWGDGVDTMMVISDPAS